jgi:C2H2-type zinc finger
VSRFYTFQQKSQEVEKMLRMNLEKLVIYNLEPAQSLPQEVAAASTLDYVSQECFSLDAIVDELNLQGDAENFVDELAGIELQEPFAGGMEPPPPVIEETNNLEMQEQCSALAVVNDPDEKVEILSCPICGKTFGSSTTKLNRHVKEHTKAKTFICDICDTGFSEKRFLLKHMVTHDKTREKTHICRVSEGEDFFYQFQEQTLTIPDL